MRRLFNKRAQSTLEYAILIAVVVGALIGMQTYVKRGLQNRLKLAADDIGQGQFEPAVTTVGQTVDHGAYTGSYTVDVEGTVTKDDSGRTVTYTEDITTTPWAEIVEP